MGQSMQQVRSYSAQQALGHSECMYRHVWLPHSRVGQNIQIKPALAVVHNIIICYTYQWGGRPWGPAPFLVGLQPILYMRLSGLKQPSSFGQRVTQGKMLASLH